MNNNAHKIPSEDDSDDGPDNNATTLYNDMEIIRSYNERNHSESRNNAINFMTGNIVSYLKTLRLVCDPTLEVFPTCEAYYVEEWERLNSPLPSDLKDFYMVTNGLRLRWLVQTILPINDEESVSPDGPVQTIKNTETAKKSELVGNISISPVQSLRQINFSPSGSTQSKTTEDSIQAVVIEEIPNYGVVALVYEHGRSENEENTFHTKDYIYKAAESNKTPTIWFQDNEYCWHQIAKDFTSYFRLALVHLGVLGWQYAFTDKWLDTECEQLMRIFAPERLVVDMANRSVKPKCG